MLYACQSHKMVCAAGVAEGIGPVRLNLQFPCQINQTVPLEDFYGKM